MTAETETRVELGSDTQAVWLLRDETRPDPEFAYSKSSLVFHWLTVVAVILLFVTNGQWHQMIGIVLSLPIMFRVWWRWSRGFPRVPDESILLSSFERLAIICNLIGLLMLTLTGLTIALFSGAEMFGRIGQWCASIQSSQTIIAVARYSHGAAAMTVYASVIVHVLSAIRHARHRSTGILLRIVKPMKGGA